MQMETQTSLGGVMGKACVCKVESDPPSLSSNARLLGQPWCTFSLSLEQVRP